MKNTNLLIGKPDSGKTRGYMFSEMEKMIYENKNLFVIDNKEEYYPRFLKSLKEKGYNIYLLNFTDPEKSQGFNILYYPYLLYKNGNVEYAIELLQGVAANLCKSNSFMDSFWESTAADFFVALLLMLFKEGKEEEIHLQSLSGMLSFIDIDGEKNILKMREYLTKLEVTDPIYRLASSTVFAPIDTRGGILSTLKTLLAPYLGRPLTLNILSTIDLDLSKLGDKTAIFFTGHDNRNKIGIILLEQLLFQIKKKNLEFVFVFDNLNKFPVITYIDEFIEYANQNKTISYFITNNLEELQEKYPKHTFEIIKNVIDINSLDVNVDISKYTAEYPNFTSKKHENFDLFTFFDKN